MPRHMTEQSSKRSMKQRRHSMPTESVTGKMLKQMLGPRDRRFAIATPHIAAEEAVVHGKVYAYECHSGLRVHATDTLEAHDLDIKVDSEPKVSVAVFLEGRLDLRIDDDLVQLGGGDEPAGHVWTMTKPSTFRRTSKKGMHVRKIVISVPPEWVMNTLKSWPSDAEQLQSFIQTHGAHFNWSPSQRAVGLAAQILNPPDTVEIIRQINVESHAIEIVAEALAALVEVDGLPVEDKPSVKSLSRASRIRTYVLAHIDEDLSLNQIAKEIGISVPSMQRSFKAAYGSTVVDFIREVRLHNARQAMDKEGISVSEAAYRAGYSSPANFSTAFKKLFGLTPSQARG